MNKTDQKIVVIEENVRPYINNVYVDYLLLPDRELKVLLALKSFAWNQRPDCYPKISTIGKLINKCSSQVKEILSILEEKNLIRIERKLGEVSTYYITNRRLDNEKLSTGKDEPSRKSGYPPAGNPATPQPEIRLRNNIKNNIKEKREPARKKRVPLSPDYIPSGRMIVFADETARRTGVDRAILITKFRNLMLSNGKHSADWDAEFENFLINEKVVTKKMDNKTAKRTDIAQKTSEIKSTVMEYGPGHPNWEANREWERKHGKHGSEAGRDNAGGTFVRKAESYLPSFGAMGQMHEKCG